MLNSEDIKRLEEMATRDFKDLEEMLCFSGISLQSFYEDISSLGVDNPGIKDIKNYKVPVTENDAYVLEIKNFLEKYLGKLDLHVTSLTQIYTWMDFYTQKEIYLRSEPMVPSIELKIINKWFTFLHFFLDITRKTSFFYTQNLNMLTMYYYYDKEDNCYYFNTITLN